MVRQNKLWLKQQEIEFSDTATKIVRELVERMLELTDARTFELQAKSAQEYLTSYELYQNKRCFLICMIERFYNFKIKISKRNIVACILIRPIFKAKPSQ